MPESSRSARAGRARWVASRIVVLVGWAALLATSAVYHYWSVESGPVVVDLEVPANTESYRTFRLRVDGHPSLARGSLHLRIEEPGRDLFEPDAGTLDLPIVETSVPVSATRGVDGTRLEEWRYVLAPECTAIPCEFDVRIGARAGGGDYLRSFVIQAVVDGTDTDDPPPGQVTLTEIGAP